MTDPTRAALAAVARGTCFFPGCRTPVMVFLGGRPEVNVEIARIRGTDPAGPRYAAGLSDRVRDSFGNLLLLCVPHRRIVDRNATVHPAALLETWRPGSVNALAGLGAISEDRLDSLLATAFTEARDQVGQALDRFELSDPQSARLLRQVIGGDDRPASEPAVKRINIGWSA
jgi:hypothetical protein